jgi:hypothetical protein
MTISTNHDSAETPHSIGVGNAVFAMDNGDNMPDPYRSYLVNAMDTAEEYGVSVPDTVAAFVIECRRIAGSPSRSEQRAGLTRLAKITITNTFHGTEIGLLVVDRGDHYEMSARQYRRMRKALCGMADCKCGQERDPNWIVEPIGGVPNGSRGATIESRHP